MTEDLTVTEVKTVHSLEELYRHILNGWMVMRESPNGDPGNWELERNKLREVC
jgi:hypothetical protein